MNMPFDYLLIKSNGENEYRYSVWGDIANSCIHIRAEVSKEDTGTVLMSISEKYDMKNEVDKSIIAEIAGKLESENAASVFVHGDRMVQSDRKFENMKMSENVAYEGVIFASSYVPIVKAFKIRNIGYDKKNREKIKSLVSDMYRFINLYK